MSSSTLSLETPLLRKAVVALLDYHERSSEAQEKKSLLGDERVVQVQFGLDQMPSYQRHKPIQLSIPHPLWRVNKDDDDEDTTEPDVCLIVKEESKEWVQELLREFPEYCPVKKVLGLDSLRRKHGRYDEQRALLHRYDVFMADDRILPMLAKALGRAFFRAKKLPTPLVIKSDRLPLRILQALKQTQLFIPQGTCVTVKYVFY